MGTFPELSLALSKWLQFVSSWHRTCQCSLSLYLPWWTTGCRAHELVCFAAGGDELLWIIMSSRMAQCMVGLPVCHRKESSCWNLEITVLSTVNQAWKWYLSSLHVGTDAQHPGIIPLTMTVHQTEWRNDLSSACYFQGILVNGWWEETEQRWDLNRK